MAIVTPTDSPKSARNRRVIEVFGGVFVLSRCFLDFSVGVGAFVIGLNQISSFFSWWKWRNHMIIGLILLCATIYLPTLFDCLNKSSQFETQSQNDWSMKNQKAYTGLTQFSCLQSWASFKQMVKDFNQEWRQVLVGHYCIYCRILLSLYMSPCTQVFLFLRF